MRKLPPLPLGGLTQSVLCCEQLWNALRPDDPLEERITKKWIDIGFQGADPATDFRGAGLLGLKQLHRFVTGATHEEAVAIYKDS